MASQLAEKDSTPVASAPRTLPRVGKRPDRKNELDGSLTIAKVKRDSCRSDQHSGLSR